MVFQMTPVERAVLQLLADGNAAVDVASRLRVDVTEIDTILTRLFERADASTSTRRPPMPGWSAAACRDLAVRAATKL
jgi:DNA-binding CsgD family transcriptional regulator